MSLARFSCSAARRTLQAGVQMEHHFHEYRMTQDDTYHIRRSPNTTGAASVQSLCQPLSDRKKNDVSNPKINSVGKSLTIFSILNHF